MCASDAEVSLIGFVFHNYFRGIVIRTAKISAWMELLHCKLGARKTVACRHVHIAQ